MTAANNKTHTVNGELLYFDTYFCIFCIYPGHWTHFLFYLSMKISVMSTFEYISVKTKFFSSLNLFSGRNSFFLPEETQS